MRGKPSAWKRSPRTADPAPSLAVVDAGLMLVVAVFQGLALELPLSESTMGERAGAADSVLAQPYRLAAFLSAGILVLAGVIVSAMIAILIA